MKKLKKFIDLKPFEKELLFIAWIRLAVIRVFISLFGFKRIHRYIKSGVDKKHSRTVEDPSFAETVAWAVHTASGYVPGARTCLIQALAVHAILSRQGIQSTIRFGIHLQDRDAFKQDRDALKAHAWVESNGVVLIGGEGIDQYTPLTASGEKEL